MINRLTIIAKVNIFYHTTNADDDTDTDTRGMTLALWTFVQARWKVDP